MHWLYLSQCGYGCSFAHHFLHCLRLQSHQSSQDFRFLLRSGSGSMVPPDPPPPPPPYPPVSPQSIGFSSRSPQHTAPSRHASHPPSITTTSPLGSFGPPFHEACSAEDVSGSDKGTHAARHRKMLSSFMQTSTS